jgi:hypothetical protein
MRTSIDNSGLPKHGKKMKLNVRFECAVSSVVEHYLDTVGVTGSNPVSRTIFISALNLRGDVVRNAGISRKDGELAGKSMGYEVFKKEGMSGFFSNVRKCNSKKSTKKRQ